MELSFFYFGHLIIQLTCIFEFNGVFREKGIFIGGNGIAAPLRFA